MSHHDVAIVGSGFAGSILARVLRQQGRRVVLLEKGRHPRFALGESTTPLANLALERLARRYDLPDLYQLSAHGRWLEHLGHLRRGLKRGFTFYRHRRGEPFRNSAANEARLMVAASPEDRIADTHWLRADVDQHLVGQAIREGVDYRDRTEVVAVEIGDGGVEITARSGERFHAETVVDASGPGGVVPASLSVPAAEPKIRSGLLFSHFQGLRPFDEVARQAGAELLPGPYPDERAAVHHLLDEGWAYVLPFDHGVASVGIVVRPGSDVPAAEEIARDPDAAWRRLIARYPTLEAQLAPARTLRPIAWVERMQHRLTAAAGPRWFALPHVVAFYDPLFSTGIAWSLLAVERLATIFDGSHGDGRSYDRLLAAEADQIERLIEAAYLTMGDFETFAAVSFLYFAVVSFHEVRQRLIDPGDGEPPHAWQGFLGADRPELRELFEDVARRLRAAGGQVPAEFREHVLRSIAPYNVAGLGDPERRNLYPVDLELLVERAPLLGLDHESVEAALPRLRGIGAD